MEKPRVKALFVNRRKGGSSESVQSVTATEVGLEGDYHAGDRGKRQILIQSESILGELGLQPGQLFENMLVDGLEVMNLPEGQRFRVGEATIEITIPCEPCSQMNRIRSGLRADIDGKRGRFARVVSPGEINVGDSLQPV